MHKAEPQAVYENRPRQNLPPSSTDNTISQWSLFNSTLKTQRDQL